MPTSGLTPAQQVAWGPQGAINQPNRLTAPPAQQQGAAGAQGPNPDDAALAALVAPRGGGAPHAVGMSPADKQYAGALLDQAQDLGDTIDGAVQQNRDAVQAFGQQSAALAQQAQAGTQAYLESQQNDQAAQQQLARETDVAQQRIDGRLADLQAQGVDPNHYWQSRSTAEKLAGAFFIGLGALAQGASGGRVPNTALDIYNQAIRDDIDAQRTNLTKSIEVTKMQGESVAKGFDQKMALLRAERESGQTAYTVAQADIQRRMGMYQANADVQLKGGALLQGLQGEKAKFIAGLNEQIYRLNKGGEKVVGGGEDLGAKVREMAGQLYKDSKGGLTPDEARRQAARLVIGIDNRPGAPEPAGWGAGSKTGQPSAKEREESAAMQDALADIAEMKRLRTAHNGGSLSPEERTRAEAFAAAASERRLAGIGRVNKQLLQKVNRIIPENPLELNAVGIVGSDPTMAKLKAAEDIIRGELGRRQPGGGAAEPDTNPAGLEEEKED